MCDSKSLPFVDFVVKSSGGHWLQIIQRSRPCVGSPTCVDRVLFTQLEGSAPVSRALIWIFIVGLKDETGPRDDKSFVLLSCEMCVTRLFFFLS